MTFSGSLGRHELLELYSCDAAILDDASTIREIMMEAARRAGATIIGERFHKFAPQGVSGVIILAESHLAIHTWPEHGFAAVDLFSCSDKLATEQCFAFLRDATASRGSQAIAVPRGERDALLRWT